MAKFTGLRLYIDAEGRRQLDAILTEGVVKIALEPDDFNRKPGWYSMDWKPVESPVGKS